jgi:DNA helicase IV
MPNVDGGTRVLTRRRGRPPAGCTVSRPVLAKGLEFDRTVVLDATAFTDARDLYVAITRGARHLTLVGTPPRLQPPCDG